MVAVMESQPWSWSQSRCAMVWFVAVGALVVAIVACIVALVITIALAVTALMAIVIVVVITVVWDGPWEGEHRALMAQMGHQHPRPRRGSTSGPPALSASGLRALAGELIFYLALAHGVT